jgi:enoyl-CoA hydratase/carnithine racemase
VATHHRSSPQAADVAWLADHSPLGPTPLVIVDLDREHPPASHRPGLPVVVGVAGSGRAGPQAIAVCDVLLTTWAASAAPWVVVEDLGRAVDDLKLAAARSPVAASIAAAVLRAGEGLDLEPALTLESLAYSTLLGGAEHRRWRADRPAPQARTAAGPAVRLHRDRSRLTISLARPQARNAFSASMRDELAEAFAMVQADSSLTDVDLRGDGPSFCAGGDLTEFGLSDDPALAHVIRSVSAPALAASRVRERLTAHVHGACVGAGIELAAAAGRIVAQPDAWFWLPELGMGLIPGAGGTATIPRRISRHRACFMALAGARIDAATALAWGLIDAIEPAA